MAKTFDGPPTIKRSGSEHRRAVFLFFPEGRRPRREVEPSLMVKKDGMILEHPSLMVKKDGMILELPSLMVKKYGYVFEKIFFLKRARELRKQNSFPFKNS